jgi:glycosyltransferase involved in cell wall biosynthesis
MDLERGALPLVSVILTTRDRPRLLATALACYAHQTYPRRQLIVVDDGSAFPADPAPIAALGGQLVRVEPDTPLGTKLNRGVEQAGGTLCQKMDDDDWYAPRFLEVMVSAVLASRASVSRPTFAYLTPFLFFDLRRWEVRASVDQNIPGATLLFERESWQERPFRNLPQDEDYWFFWDRLRLAATPLPVQGLSQFLAVRHQGGGSDRGHTWTRQWDGQRLEEYLLDRPLYPGGPEALLPAWALGFYGQLRDELRRAASGEAGAASRTDGSGPARFARSGDATALEAAPSSSLAGLIAELLEQPELASARTLDAAGAVLANPDSPPAACQQALGAVAALVFSRPDSIDASTVALLAPLFGRSWLPPSHWALAGEVLTTLLHTAARPAAVQLTLERLARAELAPAAREALLATLQQAATHYGDEFDAERLVELAEQEPLAAQRGWLLAEVVEPVLLAKPAALDAAGCERLIRLLPTDSGKYLLAYLAARPELQPAVRRAIAEALDGRFPWHAPVAARLRSGAPRVLVIQNGADGQGDELIRVAPLVEALLAYNQALEVVLVTDRAYLYGHPRVSLVAVRDGAAVRRVLEQRFEVVVHWYEADGAVLNHAPDLWAEVEAYVQVRQPCLYLVAQTGPSEFVYPRVCFDGQELAEPLGLDRPRAANVYETTLRLLAELGLPLRLGEASPGAGSILAGLPWAAAEAAWAALVAGNVERRPVALVSPFGGQDALKGYVEAAFGELAALLAELIDHGHYVILTPNGQPWGSAALARQVVALLAPDQRAQVAVAADPAAGEGQLSLEQHGGQLIPYAGYQMRLQLYALRLADLVVAAEGWMTHAAYLLGRPFRLLMLCQSGGTRWHPYGRTSRQRVLNPTASAGRGPLGQPPPLPRTQKQALTAALRGLQDCADDRSLAVLRRLLDNADPDVRAAALGALPAVEDRDLDARLLALLDDPRWLVRNCAARALLRRPPDLLGRLGLPREQLLAYAYLREWAPDWVRLLELGEAARPVLERAAQAEDFSLRQAGSMLLAHLDGPADPTGDRPAAARQPGTPPLGGWLRQLSRGPRSLVQARPRRAAGPPDRPKVLLLTPVKNAASYLEGYAARLRGLTYPSRAISVGLLESDSTDGTFEALQHLRPSLGRHFRRVGVWKRDFGYRIPEGVHRAAAAIQLERRAVLARSRNTLLLHALDDEDWVLWLDVDVIEYPPDLIERLLAADKEIVQPHCVLEYGGPTFDCNAWREQGRLHLDDLRQEGELVELDAVGGTVLLVRADLHRDGLVFPVAPYGQANPRARPGRGELETEGLGLLARDMGYTPWGMPGLEVLHDRH